MQQPSTTGIGPAGKGPGPGGPGAGGPGVDGASAGRAGAGRAGAGRARAGKARAGDPVPRLALTLSDGGPIDLAEDAFAGRPQVLLIHEPGQAGEAGACLTALLARMGERLPRLLCAAICRGPRRGAPPAADGRPPWARSLLVLEGRPEGLPPAGSGLLAWLVAPNGHLAAVHSEPQPPEALAQALAGELEGMAAPALIRPGEHHPPVLQVPDVLSREDCRRLMTIYATRGPKFVEPGHNVTGQTTDYKMRIPDYGREDRIDHWVIDRDTNAFIDERLQPRLLPEIQKAFQYRITRREFYRIARYSGSRGGQPIPHRDNSQPNVAHRRFAVTVNLNSEDFEGGRLRFPEFSEHRYRPATGAAIVFSCSLLHEVMAIEQGTRFALLAFVYGDV